MWNRIQNTLSVLSLLGAIILLFLINLGGLPDQGLLSKIYFSRIIDVPLLFEGHELRWSLYQLCILYNNNDTVQCTSPAAATPYAPAINFKNAIVPEYFEIHNNNFKNGTKAAYVFIILALVFSLISFFFQCGSFIFRRSLAPVAACFVTLAFLIDCIGLSLLVAYHTRGVNAFRANGDSATVGTLAFALLWTNVVLVFFSAVFSCRFAATRHIDKKRNNEKLVDYVPVGEPIGGHPYPISNVSSDDISMK